MKRCFREPIPELYDAARYLDAAVSAHMGGHFGLAKQLIALADMPAIREWTESIWGAGSPYVTPSQATKMDLVRSDEQARMPSVLVKEQLRERDGYHCRFCGTPVVRAEIRSQLHKSYPQALRWGSRNSEQHTAFQAMWLQYDHLVPHARGGGNGLGNLVVTCAPCNYGRMNFTLAEVGLADPFAFAPINSWWDGLERLR